MDIIFKAGKFRKECANQRLLEKKHGAQRAKLLRRRLDDMAAAETLEDLRTLPQTRAHELTGDRKRLLAVDLDHPYRLLFEAANDPVPRKPDGGLDWAKVTIVRILEVVDYHG